MKKIHLYDTTLRDGTQGEGFGLSVPEKLMLTEMLDDFGFGFIEGGWPGSSPRDQAFFEQAKNLLLRNSKLSAFGATRRVDQTCQTDPNLEALVKAEVPVVTIFGKSSAFHAQHVLGIEPKMNLDLITESVQYLKARVETVVFDAEHFFDGAREDENYAFDVLRAAVEGGADWLVLCDTNGGSLPGKVGDLVHKAHKFFSTPIGIHAHNDSELAVANSLVAVNNGATMVQGTVNGFGERCGNANLISVVPALQVKMGLHCVPTESLKQLTTLAHTVDEITNHIPMPQQAYVGRRAFAHKGGVHANAVLKDSRSYEHLVPESVGNRRRILVSDLSGRANIIMKAREYGLDLDPQHPFTSGVLEKVKNMEFGGYSFEGAEASLKLLMDEARGYRARYFNVVAATVTTTLSESSYQEGREDDDRSCAQLTIEVGEETLSQRSYGNGPVHALGTVFRELLAQHYPSVNDVRLTDYKVRILNSQMGMASTVRVLIRASDGHESWGTVGVSANVVEASWRALVDSFEYKLNKDGALPIEASSSLSGREERVACLV